LLKSVGGSLKTQPKQFQKCVSNFERKDDSLTHIKADDLIVTELENIPDASVYHFKSIFNIP
jgi:hypothetical protein